MIQSKLAISDQALLRQWWKIRGLDENLGKCSDVYKISQSMLTDREQTWSVKYRYLSGDILLTVKDSNGFQCVYVSKK